MLNLRSDYNKCQFIFVFKNRKYNEDKEKEARCLDILSRNNEGNLKNEILKLAELIIIEARRLLKP